VRFKFFAEAKVAGHVVGHLKAVSQPGYSTTPLMGIRPDHFFIYLENVGRDKLSQIFEVLSQILTFLTGCCGSASFLINHAFSLETKGIPGSDIQLPGCPKAHPR